MTWKQKGISIFRQAFNGRYLKNVKSQRSSSSWQKCEENTTPDCCPIKCLMDEATVPEGDWKENYDRENAKNSRILTIGVVSFLATFILFKRTDLSHGYEVGIF